MSTSITQNSKVVQQSALSAEMQDKAKKTEPSDSKNVRFSPLKEDSKDTKPVEDITLSLGAKKSPEVAKPFGNGFQSFAGEPKSFGSVKGNSSNNSGLFNDSTNKGTSNPPYNAFINCEKNFDGSSTTYQYNTITCSPAYRSSSIEELRLQDYQQGRIPTVKTFSKLSDKVKTDGEGENLKKEKAREEAFSFVNSTITPAASQAQLNTSLFTFRTGVPANSAAQKPAFGDTTSVGVMKPEAGTSSITNGVAGFAISSSTASTKEQPTANSTSTSKDLLHAYIEDIVKQQVREEVQKLFKDGELDDELHKIVKEELLKLIGDAVKKL